jgi:hypothetical protein
LVAGSGMVSHPFQKVKANIGVNVLQASLLQTGSAEFKTVCPSTTARHAGPALPVPSPLGQEICNSVPGPAPDTRLQDSHSAGH